MKKIFVHITFACAFLLPGAHAQSQSQPAEAVLEHYARIVHASYEDTLAAARVLRQAVHTFVAQPSEAGLRAAREAWLHAREFYGQTEVFRFYGGPIDAQNGPEGRLNAWPMDESYVDSVKGNPHTGLINNPHFVISKASLIERNEHDGEENIATGWHAIEFLLWGQDMSESGPGQRAYTDYVDGKAPHAARRRHYLGVVMDLLVEDLDALRLQWREGSRLNYRARFVAEGEESLRKIFIGMGSLSRSELAGERMEVALNSQDQEDEHSCFSDNTHRDIVTNAQGVQNVWLGQYRRRDGSSIKGPGVKDLVAAKSPALADQTTAQIARSMQLTQAIPAPFDRAIGMGSAGRPVIESAVASLVEQSKLLVRSAAAAGLGNLTLTQP